MSENYSLKWSDFHANVSQSFGHLRTEDFLQDVTLVTDDNVHTAAHKIVLSACSEYFRNIFKKNKVLNLYVCLDGVSSKELGNIMDYIYFGEVQIHQDDMDRFLEVAQRFKLEGLLYEKKIEIDVAKKKTRAPKLPKKEKEEPNTDLILPTNSQNTASSDLENVNVFDQNLYENMVEQNSEGMYVCKLCDKMMKWKTHMKYHIETHIVGLTFQCQICAKNFKSRNSLNVHRTLYHRA